VKWNPLRITSAWIKVAYIDAWGSAARFRSTPRSAGHPGEVRLRRSPSAVPDARVEFAAPRPEPQRLGLR